jgi:hypothetical protein
MPKIAFITTVFRNPGDAFIRAGIEYLIRQIIPYYHPIYIDKHDVRTLELNWWFYSSFPSSIEKVFLQLSTWKNRGKDALNEADLIIQAGTPFYYVVPDSNGNFKTGATSIDTDWIQEIWLNRILARPLHPPLINIAVGTCQPFYSDGTEFDNRPELIDFIRKSVEHSLFTTVRETVAHSMLNRHEITNQCLPCSAIFANDFHGILPDSPHIVIMNYMPGGAHYALGQTLDIQAWQDTFIKIHENLKKYYRVVIACHSANEALKAREILPHADTFFSTDYTDYIRLYSRAYFGIVNRVHAGMALAGLGRPAIIIGNDTRSRMAEMMGLPVLFVNEATVEVIQAHIESFEKSLDIWTDQLFIKKEKARINYLELLTNNLQPIQESLKNRKGYTKSDYDYTRQDFWLPYKL